MVAIRLSIIAVLVLLAPPVSAEPIRIAYSGVSASGTPVWLAKEEGIFAKHGLEADLVAVRSAPLQVTALVDGRQGGRTMCRRSGYAFHSGTAYQFTAWLRIDFSLLR